MRIDDSRVGGPAGFTRMDRSGPARSKDSQARTASSTGNIRDAADLSMLSQALNGGGTKTERLAQLRELVGSGQYEPDAEIIGRELLREAIDFRF